MKTLKLILTAILLMVAYMANAQTIQIYKNGAVVKEYSSAEVDSVVYKPAAAQPRYYYYAGWDCPKTVEELENKGTEIENFESLRVGTQIVSFEGTLRHPENKYDYCYIIIPKNTVGIYDGEGSTRIESTFNEPYEEIEGYYTFKDLTKSKILNGVILRKL